MKRDYKLFLNDIDECILVIGESAKNIPMSLKEKNKNVPWSEMSQFRNFIIHSYYEMSLKRIWNFIKRKIPEIKEGMKKIVLV